jgi:hypothetical protein
MRTDPITRIVQLHSQLSTEKARLESRLARINKALAAIHGQGAAPVAAPVAAAAAAKPAKKGTPGKRRNKLSLVATMVSVMGSRALTKAEIYKAILDAGYKFTGTQHMNSLNVQLYTKGQFVKRPGKKFVVAPALAKKLAPKIAAKLAS